MRLHNRRAAGAGVSKWAPASGEMTVCALHKLPVKTRKGKRFGRVPGKGVDMVDTEIAYCPAGCTDPHVKVEGDVKTPVAGLVTWKRPLAIDEAKANLAEYDKDKAAYLAKVLPVKVAPEPSEAPKTPKKHAKPE